MTTEESIKRHCAAIDAMKNIFGKELQSIGFDPGILFRWEGQCFNLPLSFVEILTKSKEKKVPSFFKGFKVR